MEPPPLIDLHLRLASKCNLNCKHCYASDWFTRSDVLDAALVRTAIDDAIELGLQRVTFTGGEPLLHPQVFDLMQYCVTRGLRAKLETNGLLLRQHGGRMLELLRNHRELAYLYVSYDLAEQRELSDAAHRLLREVILELHRDGVDVHVQSAITEINRHRMHELLEPAREHGIPQRIFVTHSALGNGQAMTAFALDEVLAIYDELKSLGLPLTVELPPLITGGASRSCGWGLRRCEIMANGDVTTCGPIVFTQTAFIAGNLRDQPLRELWQRSEYFSSLRAVDQSQFAGVCGKCKHFETCRGSCRAFAWSHLDDWFSPYPLCQAFAERYPERVREQLLDEDIALPPVRARTGGTRSLRVVQEPT